VFLMTPFNFKPVQCDTFEAAHEIHFTLTTQNVKKTPT